MAYQNITIEDMREYLDSTINGIGERVDYWKFRGEDKKRLRMAMYELDTVLKHIGGKN